MSVCHFIPSSRSSALGVAWAQYGPYHFARVQALRRVAGVGRVRALEFSNVSRDYPWERAGSNCDLVTIYPNIVTEELRFRAVFSRARRVFAELGIRVCLLPSYSPKQSLAALLAAKSLGIRTVMMNESHAGTSRARGFSAVLKRLLVGLFDSALVGGQPQKRYFASLGMAEEKIFTGYDAVDNDYFAARAEAIRKKGPEVRNEYDLPEHYFLSLGRFVAKKNLSTLVRAFRSSLDSGPAKQTHLVMVGSGEEEQNLKILCRESGLPVYDKQQAPQLAHRNSQFAYPPGVHFYGFRQIEENPVFYALADAFILSSLREEWGLVVNEAMASSLPVVVSETAGCAQDLLEPSHANEALSPATRSQLAELRLAARLRQNGFVFDPNSSQELSRILLFLKKSPDMRFAMGRASRRIIDKFSCENFARSAVLAAEAALGAGIRHGVEREATGPAHCRT